MKKNDIVVESLEYKGKIERTEGNLYNSVSLDGVARAFREGAKWRINSVWHDKTAKPKVGELIICIHEKGKFVGILQEDQFFISSRQGCIRYFFDEIIKWAYVEDLMFNTED